MIASDAGLTGPIRVDDLWLYVGPVQMQPSELGKLALARAVHQRRNPAAPFHVLDAEGAGSDWMTKIRAELADGVVYSRSGLTYQAGLLEEAGLIARGPSPDDERATLVTITGTGLALVGRVLPGHVQVVRQMLFDPLTSDDVGHLGDIMTRVRDHMRAKPPRSAAPRKRRTGPAATATPQD